MSTVGEPIERPTVTWQGVAGSVDAPSTWRLTATDDGRGVLLPVDLERFAGDGFVPNVTVQVSPTAADLDPARAGQVLSEQTADAGDSRRRTAIVRTPLGDPPLLQHHMVVTSDVGAVQVIGTATWRQWSLVATDFDEIARTAAVTAAPESSEADS